MKRLVFSFSLLSLLPMMVWAEEIQVLVWPQPEAFYDSKAATPSRRVVEPATPSGYAYPAQVAPQLPAIAPVQPYGVPSMGGYPSVPMMPQAFPNSPSGFLPAMPQNLPSARFTAPTMSLPSVPNMMPGYGNMPISPMLGFGSTPFGSSGFPNSGFGNMMPFLGGNSFSGMPFGFGY